MSSNLFHTPQPDNFPEVINAVVEIPKGTNVKYEYDHIEGHFVYDRSLLSPMVYPSSYGFIPQTIGPDHDPLDVLIYNNTPIDRGTVVESKVLGVLDMEDQGEKDYKVLVIPTSHIRDHSSIEDIDPLFLKLCKNFFAHYKDLSQNRVVVHDWHSKEEAYKIINQSKLT
jgi:inorganic pyrophosphatase